MILYLYNLKINKIMRLSSTKPMLESSQEIILCSAIAFSDKQNNLNYVFGYRHSDCIDIARQMSNVSLTREMVICGFLTNKNRFLNHKDAYKIAYEANQIIGPNKGYTDNEIGLTSEDLY